ncbi:MAG: cation-efflux pump, partial [Lachnospiraceae bacterium]|nr:cation-efflux pump [Lachnospiraceae bacterium]
LDRSCDEQTENRMRELILSQEGVLGLSLLHTRMFGARIYVDAEIEVDGEMKLKDSHEIAHRVHDAIEREFETVKHIMIHVNPY